VLAIGRRAIIGAEIGCYTDRRAACGNTGARERTVRVPGGETTIIALDLTNTQRKHIREALRRRNGSGFRP